MSNRRNSLSEVFSSVNVPVKAHFLKKLLAFTGPGFMVAVGYMDPGNWATDIAGGSQFGYTLLSVVLVSSLFAIVLQYLALKLGIAAEQDLAQACRQQYSRPVNLVLWVLCEIAIVACDLAEVIGSAIALNLLFGLPLAWGVCITGADVLLILYFQKRGFRYLESLVITLILTVLVCFGIEIIAAHPGLLPVIDGFIPQRQILYNPAMLYIAIGILGATVMPHNLYLHSSVVQTRNYPRSYEGKKMALRFAAIDSSAALTIAFFVNAAILILAASAFHFSGHQNVADINDAYKLLNPLLGTSIAGTLFAVALLASGQNSTLTGTLAGQIVMEGFLNLKVKPWLRRLITRLLAIVPALVITLLYQQAGLGKLLVLSQVILSIQLSFAVIPLIVFTSKSSLMGPFVNSKALRVTSAIIAAIILLLNMALLAQVIWS